MAFERTSYLIIYYLFSQRKKKPFLNYFEFPGGKIEGIETPEQCLIRECFEELGINVIKNNYNGKITHLYDDISVQLHIFEIIEYEGNIKPKEKQNLEYIDYFKSQSLFLESTSRILNKIELKELFFVTPKLSTKDFRTLKIFDYDNSFIRLRSYDYSKSEYISLAKELSKFCIENKIQLIFDKKYSDSYENIHFNGIHYTSADLNNIRFNHIPQKRLTYSASCHNINDIYIANQYNLDFILLSPVKKSKYNQRILGWDNFKSLALIANMPVFALGGVNRTDLELCKSFSGYGVSGISNFWL